MRIPLRYNIRSLRQRKVRTILTILGIAGSVAMFVAMMAFSHGIVSSFKKTGSEDNVVIVQRGAFSQSLSSIPKSAGNVISYMPHIRQEGGLPLVSPELCSGSRGDRCSRLNRAARKPCPARQTGPAQIGQRSARRLDLHVRGILAGHRNF
jgi:hypothetical protein